LAVSDHRIARERQTEIAIKLVEARRYPHALGLGPVSPRGAGKKVKWTRFCWSWSTD